jgi:hypothetical protein
VGGQERIKQNSTTIYRSLGGKVALLMWSLTLYENEQRNDEIKINGFGTNTKSLNVAS